MAPPSVWSILLLSLLFLAAAHLAVKDFFPNPVFWVIGAFVIVVAGILWVLIRNDNFGFFLAIFVCVHFSFADNQGGLWSYVICAVVLIVMVMKRNSGINLASVPRSVTALVIILMAHQLLGTILNDYSLIENIQATVVGLSQLIIFYFCASQLMTESNIKRLLSMWFFVISWVFMINLNQIYHWVITKTPLLPQRYLLWGKLSSIPAGSFGNSELCAEYFCIAFVFSLIVIGYLKELASLQIKKIFPLFIILISSAALVMGASRSAVLLALAAAFYIIFLNYFVAPSARNLKRFFIFGAVLCLTGILIFNFGSFFELNEMVKDFKEIKPASINVETVISGKSINRSFTSGYQRLGASSWWVGYGYNLPANNLKSLGMVTGGAADYHSLYICLPFFYGWLGAIAYFLIVFLTGIRSYIYYLKIRKLNSFLVPIALGFAMLWGIFLLDQYKISITRNPSYFLLTWMWLGLTHATVNSINYFNFNKKIPN